MLKLYHVFTCLLAVSHDQLGTILHQLPAKNVDRKVEEEALTYQYSTCGNCYSWNMFDTCKEVFCSVMYVLQYIVRIILYVFPPHKPNL
jgi:hypothetical protein